MTRSRRILIWTQSEDRASKARAALADLLEMSLVECSEEERSEEVMAAVLGDRADLLVADLGDVPHCAVVTLQNVKRVRPKMPVITISSEFNEQFREGVLPLGIHFFLSADYPGEELCESVKSGLKLETPNPRP